MGKYEKQIQELLGKMTLEEKVGQLQQCGPSLVGAFEVSFEELLDMMFDGRISQEEFNRLMGTAKQDFHEEDLRAGKVGSYNGIGDAATVNRLQKIAVEETRLGIPLVFGYDVIHGFQTVTPIPLAESCAWDPDLWERTGRLAAEEATAGGVHMTFAPMVDVAKDARWGRVSEGAGEDVLLNSLYGAAKVKGFQGDDLTKEDAMAACVKHFAAYGAIEAGRDYNRVDMSLQRLYEEYLPSYKACVDAGARAIMPAFNDINGVPCSTNKWLLTDVLRKDWGFDGMTVSDANAIAECVNHGIAADGREAAKLALEAGMDMDMTSNTYIAHVQDLVESGEVKEEVLDRAVADILRVKFELGLFDNPYKTGEEREKAAMLTPEARALALEAAQKSIVLLKNAKDENGRALLPLAKGTKLAVFGKTADMRAEMTGAWAIGADGETCVSLIDACKAKGIDYTYDADGSDEAIQAAAAEADVLLAVLGEMKDESGEASSRASITISHAQTALLRKLVSTGKPVVVLLFNGRPLAIPKVDELANAVVEAWHLGTEAGNAVLDVLFGEVNPSAKLTTTFPGVSGQTPMYYAHINTGRPGGKSKFTSKYLDAPNDPVYPFGYGLSYTEYAYSDLAVELKKGAESAAGTAKADERAEGAGTGKAVAAGCAGIVGAGEAAAAGCAEAVGAGKAYLVSVTVKNIGDRAGEEVVQCYVRDVVGARVRPVKELKAFEKIALAAGEEKRVTFEIPVEKLGYYGPDMQYRVDPGEFIFYVGGNSRDCLEETAVFEG